MINLNDLDKEINSKTGIQNFYFYDNGYKVTSKYLFLKLGSSCRDLIITFFKKLGYKISINHKTSCVIISLDQYQFCDISLTNITFDVNLCLDIFHLVVFIKTYNDELT